MNATRAPIHVIQKELKNTMINVMRKLIVSNIQIDIQCTLILHVQVKSLHYFLFSIVQILNLSNIFKPNLYERNKNNLKILFPTVLKPEGF